HVEVAGLVEEAEVAGAQPAVRREHTRRRLGVVVVPAHDARALHADLADIHRGQRHARRVFDVAFLAWRQDTHGDATAGAAHGDEPAGRIGLERCAGRPDRDGQCGLREAVTGGDNVLETEVPLEVRDRRRAYGLGTGERGPQAAEIDPRGVPDVAHAVAVA